MASRPTPFGQFSGISYGNISSSNTSLKISNNIESFIRFDEEFILKLTDKLTTEPSIKERITYFLNSTISVKQNDITYIEYVDEENNRYYRWRRIQRNPLLAALLSFTEEKGYKYSNIVLYICNLNVDRNRAQAFIDELISIKFLIPELEPIVTKDDSNKIFSKAHSFSSGTKYTNILQRLAEEFIRINQYHEFPEINNPHKLAEKILPSSVKHLFQVDSHICSSSNQINESLINQISNELEEISVLNKQNIPADLQLFIKAFQMKYGEQEVPLLEALDPEIGIGYGSVNSTMEETLPLLNGFMVSKRQDNDERLNSFLHSILEERAEIKQKKASAIELKETDLERLRRETENNGDNYPLGFYLLGNLLCEKNNNLNKENFKFNILNAGGVSALPLMTRFSHLDDKINAKLHTIAKYEEKQANGILLAEIVFLPNRRSGNILSRPSFYQYEIPIIGQASVDKEHTIKLEDLHVKVTNGKIILTSFKLNKEIIPRLSSAHNFHYGMVVYRFLCDLQMQSNAMNIKWDWGSLSPKQFLPRVIYKHLILSRARWKIKQCKFVSNDLVKNVKSLKETYDLPDQVLLIERDNELLIDLQSLMGVEIFLKELSKNDVEIVEYIYDSFQSAVIDENGKSFNNEIILPFKGGKYRNKAETPLLPLSSIKRQFQLGSEWLYFKLYCSERIGDVVLNGPIKALISKLKTEKRLNKWFFIRYSDPEPHLRIRLLLDKEDNSAIIKVIQYINQYLEPLLEQKKISKIVYDTY